MEKGAASPAASPAPGGVRPVAGERLRLVITPFGSQVKAAADKKSYEPDPKPEKKKPAKKK